MDEIVKVVETNKTLRLLQTGFSSGAYNMALDEALWQHFAEQHQTGQLPAPILRFYGWQPSALSLGYAQRAEREVDFEACARLGIDWVRRPTGGRAILHEPTELTYSLVAATDDARFSGGVLESYRKISGALVRGLELLRLSPEVAGKDKRGADGDNTAACFDAASAYEITSGGRKIIGSAQARRGNVLLQQGTILLAVNVPKLFEVLKPPARLSQAEAIEQVSARLTSIEEATGRKVAFEEAQNAFTTAFEQHFAAELLADKPTEVELRLAAELVASKYANPLWNMQRQRPAPAFS